MNNGSFGAAADVATSTAMADANPAAVADTKAVGAAVVPEADTVGSAGSGAGAGAGGVVPGWDNIDVNIDVHAVCKASEELEAIADAKAVLVEVVMAAN